MSRTDPSSFQRAAWAQLQQVAASHRDVARRHLKGLLEALVLAAAEPLPLRNLARWAKASRQETEELVRELQAEYRDRGVRLEEVGGGYSFRTAPAYGPFVRELVAKKPVRMSRALLETLAIISYRQPITRPEIDDIRGVDSGPVLRTLLDRDLIRILGKKEEPGRPLLYSTTDGFLRLFGLTGLASLPTLREFTELTEDSRHAYEMEIGDEAPLDPLGLRPLELDDEEPDPLGDELAPAGPDDGALGMGDDSQAAEDETFARGSVEPEAEISELDEDDQDDQDDENDDDDEDGEEGEGAKREPKDDEDDDEDEGDEDDDEDDDDDDEDDEDDDDDEDEDEDEDDDDEDDEDEKDGEDAR